MVRLAWRKAPNGVYKLNIDVTNNISDVLVTECWAFCLGIRVAKNSKILLEIESDII